MHNSNVALRGRRLLLVPYLEQHVPRYHQWMCDPELLAATCSEPLTLQEEYENQISWLESTDKLTFILLAPLSAVLSQTGIKAAQLELKDSRAADLESEGCDCATPMLPPSADGTVTTPLTPVTELRAALNTTFVMVGDCNLFVSPNAEEEGVEIEVMIGEKSLRRHGFAQEALYLLMSYAARQLGCQHYVAKVLESNVASQRLFTEKMGFSLFKEVKVFHELHFERRCGAARLRTYGEPCGVAETLEERQAICAEWETEFPFEQCDYPSAVERITVLQQLPVYLQC